MADDPIAARSRSVLPFALGAERRVAAAILAKDGPALLRLSREIDAARGGAPVNTGCDVALTMLSTAAAVLGNPDTTLAGKRRWADTGGDFVAERIATFLSSCEEDAGSPRRQRFVTAALLTSF